MGQIVGSGEEEVVLLGGDGDGDGDGEEEGGRVVGRTAGMMPPAPASSAEEDDDGRMEIVVVLVEGGAGVDDDGVTVEVTVAIAALSTTSDEAVDATPCCGVGIPCGTPTTTVLILPATHPIAPSHLYPGMQHPPPLTPC